MDEATFLITVGVSTTLAMVAMIAVYSRQYKRVPPGQAMVVFGRPSLGGKPRIVMRGGRFIQPIIESYALISLEPIQIDLVLEDVVAGGPGDKIRRMQVSVTGVARVSEDEGALQAAASQLVNKSHEDLRRTVEVTLEGHTRNILATEPSAEASVSKIAEKTRTRTEADLAAMGIGVQSLFLRIRAPTSTTADGTEAIEQLNRELHQFNLRIRRIEEKLALGDH